ncbi:MULTISPECIES: hypothetical protein [Myxococcus]|uniref:hypothetical protein n=1 Tax=Myxococcus TaxID=32 RepID=UPI001F07B414|nr:MULTISPECIES: hypothetical protein [Myxococcus]
MLVIRHAQLEALDAPAQEHFIEEILSALPEVFPGDARVLERQPMRALIEDGIARASRLGLTGGGEVSRYVFLLHELGPGFEDAARTRWMGRLLRDPELPPSVRMDAVYARLEASSGKGLP